MILLYRSSETIPIAIILLGSVSGSYKLQFVIASSAPSIPERSPSIPQPTPESRMEAGRPCWTPLVPFVGAGHHINHHGHRSFYALPQAGASGCRLCSKVLLIDPAAAEF